jgi:hypothetical protein
MAEISLLQALHDQLVEVNQAVDQQLTKQVEARQQVRFLSSSISDFI